MKKTEKKKMQNLKWAIAHLSIRLGAGHWGVEARRGAGSAKSRHAVRETQARDTGGAGRRHSSQGLAGRCDTTGWAAMT